MADKMPAPPPAPTMAEPGAAPATTEASALAPRTKTDNVFCGSNPFDLCVPCNLCFVVPERTNYVELYFGHYHGTITQPGCYCRSAIAIELRRVATDIVTFEMPNTKVLDQRGSPVVISGIITYSVVDARAAAIDVSDPHRFVRDQAPAILKRIVSMYPYESEDASQPSLKTETLEIATRMRDSLQAKCAIAGVEISSFSINELSYAPEIAATMLRRQQAEALVAARKAIVMGAKEIAKEAVQDVGEGMSEEQRASLLSNLLVVLVGDKDVTPTLQI